MFARKTENCHASRQNSNFTDIFVVAAILLNIYIKSSILQYEASLIYSMLTIKVRISRIDSYRVFVISIMNIKEYATFDA